MRLISVDVHGYKRFAEPTKLNLDGKVVAVVGPNEAGKTSVLEALRLVDHDDEVSTSDRTRRLGVPDDQVVVTALYLLGPEDREAISHLHGVSDGHIWLRVTKQANGSRDTSIEPRLRRNTKARRGAVEPLRTLLNSPWLQEEVEPSPVQDPGPEMPELKPLEPTAIDPVIAHLDTDARTLDDDTLAALDRGVQRLESLEGGPQYAAKTIAQLRRVLDHEVARHPNAAARDILWARRPEAIWFGDEQRGLRYEYDLTTEADAPSPALANLARVGGLDLLALRTAISGGETDTAAYLLERANEMLKQQYDSWTQSGVRPHLDRGDGLLLYVHASNEAGGYMKFNERSAGLRTYVALVAAATAAPREVKPIFLIDEAEMHLHYDAQADLINVFTQQDAVAQIIYTTHSAGCLPEDLGSGIRIVEPILGSNHSRVRNKFWTDEPGFSPLLLGMGASTLAFFPTRDAVIGEGPTELVMLGTLLREAIGREQLGFQIVPGSANARPSQIGGLDLQSPQMAWVVDGDEGGRGIATKVTSQNVPANRVVPIGGNPHSGLVIEDLVAPGVYAKALNEEINRRGEGELPEITAADLGDTNRPAQAAAWCVSNDIPMPDKVAVAHHVVEMRSIESLVDPERAEIVRQLYADLRAAIERTG